LKQALEDVKTMLQETGCEVKLQKIHIQTKALAIEHKFVSSPTIRVNGSDIQLEVKEDLCPTCGTLTEGSEVLCRVWNYQGKEYPSPPKELILDAIISHISGHQTEKKTDSEVYILPKNLVQFFATKKRCGEESKNDNSCCDETSNSCCDESQKNDNSCCDETSSACCGETSSACCGETSKNNNACCAEIPPVSSHKQERVSCC
jgi:hypothetical protein